MTQRVVRREDGAVQIVNCDIPFLVCIPSRGRAERVVNNPFFPVGNVFVHESEYEDYQRTFQKLNVRPGGLFTHNRDGVLPAIRNVMLDLVQDEAFTVQLDDDYAGMYRNFTWRNSQIKTRDLYTIIDIFTQDYGCARDIGAGLFFFAQTPTPWERHAYLPFRLRGWGMSACMGHLKPRELRFDENLLMKSDVDLCLQAVALYRVIWQDMRFWGWCDEKGGRTGMDVGGLASVRTIDKEMEMFRYLQAKWGPEIVKAGKPRGGGITVHIAIPQRYKAKRPGRDIL